MNNTAIKDFILESELFTHQEIQKAEDLVFEKNIDFVDALFQLNLLDQETLLKISAAVMGLPKVDLKSKTIPLDVFREIPDLISDKHNLVAFERKGEEISIAFCQMDSLDIIDKIFKPEVRVNLFWTDREELLEKKKKYLELIKEEFLFQAENSSRKILKSKNFGYSTLKELPDTFASDIANDIYVDKFLDSLISYALKSQADSIFFNLSDKYLEISFRIFDRNYFVLRLNKDILLSISLRLKFLTDISFSKDFIIEQESFSKSISGEEHQFFITFVKTDLGESISIQIDKNKKFKTPVSLISPKQQDLFLKFQRKDSGMFLLFGDNLSQKSSLYSFLEFDIEKYKNIYSIEENILYPLPHVKQISLSKKDKLLPILVKIIDERADVLALEKINSAVLPMLFNFVSTSKKVFLLSSMEIGNFLDTFLEKDFDKGQIVKNMSLILEHQNFVALKEKEDYYLNKDEQKLLKSFLEEGEIQEIFLLTGHKKESEKKLSKIKFYREKQSKSFIFRKRQKNKIINFSSELIYGILDFGLFLEKEFIKRNTREKIKNNLRREVKRAILENALILSHRGEINIKEILQFLTK